MYIIAFQITSNSTFVQTHTKENTKLCVIGLCEGNPPVTSEFPSQSASNVENAPISLCHRVFIDSV